MGRDPFGPTMNPRYTGRHCHIAHVPCIKIRHESEGIHRAKRRRVKRGKRGRNLREIRRRCGGTRKTSNELPSDLFFSPSPSSRILHHRKIFFIVSIVDLLSYTMLYRNERIILLTPFFQMKEEEEGDIVLRYREINFHALRFIHVVRTTENDTSS